MIDLSAKLEPSFGAFSSGLEDDIERTIEDVTAKIVRSVAEDAPDEMRALMLEGGKSVKGAPPRKRSGALGRSLKGNVAEPDSLEISMIYYGGYLDPLFMDQNFKGAGWADRPFVEKGIERALAKTLADLK